MTVPANPSVVVTEPTRPRCTVEIETFAKTEIPKVTVRVDDDDPEKARNLAVWTYLTTVQSLIVGGVRGDDEEE